MATHFSVFDWASLVAQMIKNLSTLQETWVQSLGGEDPVEKGIGRQRDRERGDKERKFSFVFCIREIVNSLLLHK